MDRKTNDAPRRIAVLGGGMAALTAIYQLTNEKDWKDRYDITLFQTGWRLGGKGASGRDPENAYRIEEHGLHLWFGCYQNAFNLIQSCYNELDRETGAPLSSWKSAFEPATFVGLHENVNGESVYWPLHFPITDEDPGGDDKLPTVWDNVSRMIKILVERYLEAVVTYTFRPPANLDKAEQEFYVQFNEELTVYLRDLSRMFGIDVASASVKDGMELMETFLDEARKSGNYDILLSVSEEVRNWFWDKIEDVVYEYHGVRRMWVLFDLTIGTMTGVIKDRLQYRGLDVINDMDFREWISQYCLTPELTAWSAPIQAMYSLIFCGKNKHTFEAGTCLRCIFRVALNYKGAFYYRMQAGMGDTIFTPFYELLKRRGVKIKFFHKIQEVHLNEDKSEIESIRIQKQVELKSEEYQPLFDVNGLDCWPSHPLWDQLKDGDKVKESGVNFEHYSDNWEGATEFEWQAGRDFDHVLFGI